MSIEEGLEGGEEPFRVLEFYSGIGGMRFSLEEAGIHAKVVEAFDINNVANEVYEHNFGHYPYQGNIQSLTAAQLDKFRAHAWFLSPPCQPYTRQGLQKDAEDARASSFLKIIELISLTLFPPTKLFVENVVGFESSITHKRMMEVLEKTGFVTQEFISSPIQFGVPYSRPRYFCLAKKAPFTFPRPEFNGQLLSDTSLLNSGGRDNSHIHKVLLNATFECKVDNVNEGEKETHISCRPIKDFLEAGFLESDRFGCTEIDFCMATHESMGTEEAKNEFEDSHAQEGSCLMDEKECLVYSRDLHRALKDDSEGAIAENDSCILIGRKECHKTSKWEQYKVPVCLIERWGDAMDIVFPDSRRCCCFTKSYGRYVKGTGSLLATTKDTQSNVCADANDLRQGSKLKLSLLQELDLRYFTPREVANLHSFPEEFSFPNHINLRQRYALLGNSLSIAVVAPLFKYLFTD